MVNRLSRVAPMLNGWPAPIAKRVPLLDQFRPPNRDRVSKCYRAIAPAAKFALPALSS
jgi:hypothetical protein